MKKLYSFILLFIIISNNYSQIGINTKNPKASLHISKPSDLENKSVGIIIPSLDEQDKIKLKLTSEQDGLLIYNNESKKINIYDSANNNWKIVKDNTDNITTNPNVYVSINEVDKNTSLINKIGEIIYSVPLSMNNYKISEVQCSVYNLGFGSNQTKINVLRRSNGTNSEIATIILDNNSYTTNAEILNNNRVLSGDIIFLEITNIPEISPKGLTCTLGFNL